MGDLRKAQPSPWFLCFNSQILSFILRMLLYYLHFGNAAVLNEAGDAVVLDVVYTSSKFYRDTTVTRAV